MSAIVCWSVTETWSMWNKVVNDWQNLLSIFSQTHKICPLGLFLLFFPLAAQITDGGASLSTKFPVACWFVGYLCKWKTRWTQQSQRAKQWIWTSIHFIFHRCTESFVTSVAGCEVHLNQILKFPWSLWEASVWDVPEETSKRKTLIHQNDCVLLLDIIANPETLHSDSLAEVWSKAWASHSKLCFHLQNSLASWFGAFPACSSHPCHSDYVVL